MEPELRPYREEEDRARGWRRFGLGDRDGGAWARGLGARARGRRALGLGEGDDVARALGDDDTRALGDGGARARGRGRRRSSSGTGTATLGFVLRDGDTAAAWRRNCVSSGGKS
jgi:hypothetical protein